MNNVSETVVDSLRVDKVIMLYHKKIIIKMGSMLIQSMKNISTKIQGMDLSPDKNHKKIST